MSKFSENELCRIYDNLNNWLWDDLLGEKPKGWDKLPNYHSSQIKEILLNSRHKIVNPILLQIEEILGNRKLLEWHWVNNLGKTKEEFETWLFNKMEEEYLNFRK